jgi:hypothetical protein
MFRVLGIYNFGGGANIIIATLPSKLSSWNCWNRTHFKDIIPKERK